MVFASPRGMCESWRRVCTNGWKDPNDRSAPVRTLRVKLNNGTYEPRWFRYDLPLKLSSYDALHPDDVKKLTKQQTPQKQRYKKPKSRGR
jgi:hypothetical protein